MEQTQMTKTTTKEILQLWHDTGWNKVKELTALPIAIWRNFDKELLRAAMKSVLERYNNDKLDISDDTSIFRYITAITKANTDSLKQIEQEMAAAAQELGKGSHVQI